METKLLALSGLCRRDLSAVCGAPKIRVPGVRIRLFLLHCTNRNHAKRTSSWNAPVSASFSVSPRIRDAPAAAAIQSPLLRSTGHSLFQENRADEMAAPRTAVLPAPVAR